MRELLLPISLIYSIVLKIRHKMYDWGWLHSRKWDIPTICVGNLELGGTGKTPLTEYLVRMLMNDRRVAIVSGGYKRKSTKIVIANACTTLEELGDEPMQYRHKFGDRITVAVGKNRCQVIEKLLEDNSFGVILFDDAFQHRRISAGLNILTTNFQNPFYDNRLLPSGTLRDLKGRAKNADIIIVSKTPDNATEEQKNLIRQGLLRYGNKSVYFASIGYGNPVACNPAAEKKKISHNDKVVALCGIAQPDYFIKHMESAFCVSEKKVSGDHHSFSEKDLQRIKEACEEGKIIVTTEKDAMRLTNNPYFSTLKEIPVYYIPIEVKFNADEASQLKKEILSYVEENK